MQKDMDVQKCWAHWEERQWCWWGGSGRQCVRRRRVGAAIVGEAENCMRDMSENRAYVIEVAYKGTRRVYSLYKVFINA